MNLVRDVLDNQIVDRNQTKMGKVDGIVFELRDGQPPRLLYLESGFRPSHTVCIQNSLMP
ncbi:hypothetical protein H6F89_19485 [Cyanobacteria bacterium FACHB-63]|nr:hypothetical protein [Cyanobacteria bacterium FACHB-63]